MSEANKLNLKVSTPGERPQDAFRHKTRPPTMEEVIGWIRSLRIDPEVQDELIKKAKKYPIDAMYRFREKINHHIKEINKKRRESRLLPKEKEE